MTSAPALAAIRSALEEHEARVLESSRRAAVASVVRQGPGREPELLLIKRSEHPEDPWSGHMAFPGGRVDAGDPGPLAAAIRETREEIGLDLGSDADLLGQLSSIRASARGRRLPLVIDPFVFGLPPGSSRPTLSFNYEVDEAHWIPVNFFADSEQRSTFWWRRTGIPVPLPCCRWKGRVVWGLTLRMVDELVGLFHGA